MPQPQAEAEVAPRESAGRGLKLQISLSGFVVAPPVGMVRPLLTSFPSVKSFAHPRAGADWSIVGGETFWQGDQFARCTIGPPDDASVVHDANNDAAQ